MPDSLRSFVVVGHRACTDDGFNLDDLCGSAGRLDVLVRAVNSALMLSHSIRRDSDIYLVLSGPPDPPRTIRIRGDNVRYLNPDERSTGALLKQALSRSHLVSDDGGYIESTPGIYISAKGLGGVCEELSTRPIICLDSSGDDIRDATIPHNPVFLLSDHMVFSEEDRKIIDSFCTSKISLGPVVVHTHHAITLAHNELDRCLN